MPDFCWNGYSVSLGMVKSLTILFCFVLLSNSEKVSIVQCMRLITKLDKNHNFYVSRRHFHTNHKKTRAVLITRLLWSSG